MGLRSARDGASALQVRHRWRKCMRKWRKRDSRIAVVSAMHDARVIPAAAGRISRHLVSPCLVGPVSV